MSTYQPAGMLWWDNSPTPIANKIKQAAEYYAAKYGPSPNMAYVHPAALPDGEMTTAEGIRVMTAKSIGKNHILIGRTESEAGNE